MPTIRFKDNLLVFVCVSILLIPCFSFVYGMNGLCAFIFCCDIMYFLMKIKRKTPTLCHYKSVSHSKRQYLPRNGLGWPRWTFWIRDDEYTGLQCMLCKCTGYLIMPFIMSSEYVSLKFFCLELHSSTYMYVSNYSFLFQTRCKLFLYKFYFYEKRNEFHFECYYTCCDFDCCDPSDAYSMLWLFE